MATSTTSTTIAIIGAGTIGLSFAALHLTQDPHCHVILHDPRPDLRAYVDAHLPAYFADLDPAPVYASRWSLAPDLAAAVRAADIVQEQGPETAAFKSALWPRVEAAAPPTALLWSSTSGIPASAQAVRMRDPSRLLVVHPFNPPHLMPLLELVPAPTTAAAVVQRTLEFWRGYGRAPVVVRKECVGFVANRLAFALFREACSLVAQGVVDVEGLDEIVTSSMGPRWAVAGPFKAYHAGGGEAGLTGFMEKIGGTVDACWKASEGDWVEHGIEVGGAWQEGVCRQAYEAYGTTDTVARDRRTRKVLEAAASP